MITFGRCALALCGSAVLLVGLSSNPVTAQAADLEAGRKVFESVCAACHGVTGRSDPSNPVVQALDA